ncbi:hypothetical protein [Reichenbachiella versicolor]|uniref:hypothetical protein n=1 Tax=Reichenbachiella versicolor TaxID=1821036 RepID=UPI001C87C100|nr:hypothetical protein [Reichenbachiella versicolor]
MNIKYPNHPLILTNIGAILSDLGKHKEALAYLESAKPENSADRNLVKNMGIVKMNLDNEDLTARTYFDKAKNLQPNELTIEAFFDPHGY